MRESVTYQIILEEGRAEGVAQGKAEGKAEGKVEGAVEAERKVLFRLGTKKFGPPASATIQKLQAINDVDQLAALTERVLDVSSWDELFSSER